MNRGSAERLVDLWIAEDRGRPNPYVRQRGSEVLVAQGEGVWCCGWIIPLIFNRIHPVISNAVSVHEHLKCDEWFSRGAELAYAEGNVEALRYGNRIVINLISRMCAIAANTRRAVEAVRGFNVIIRDTRKTTPGLRELEKEAVRAGGGYNHRFGMDDGILIKPEDIAFAGGIVRAIDKACASQPDAIIEVEVKTLADLATVLDDDRAKKILLDNMSLNDTHEAVGLCGDTHTLEASGVGGKDLRAVAKTGVHEISLGSLTTDVKNVKMHWDKFKLL